MDKNVSAQVSIYQGYSQESRVSQLRNRGGSRGCLDMTMVSACNCCDGDANSTESDEIAFEEIIMD